MNKPTPGPWHTGTGNGEGSIFADDGRMKLDKGATTLYPICQMITGYDEAEDTANAALIAAAPDLADCLRAMVDFYSMPAHCQTTTGDAKEAVALKRKARAALRKAEGDRT